MNKNLKTALAVALCAMGVMTSCTNKDPKLPTQQEIETKIVGKWKLASKDGEPYLTDNKMVHTFMTDGQCISSFSRGFKVYPDSYWANQMKFPYAVDNNVVSLNILGHTLTFEINKINNQIFAFDKTQSIVNGKVMSSSDRHHEYYKVTKDFSKDIIGLWEGVAMTGQETYGGIEARIKYASDGTYTYYIKDNDNWVASKNVDNEYNVDGDWLACRWRPEADAEYNYEWWDIESIQGDEMKWTALRKKDNSTFTTTFTWKRVK